MNLIVSGEHRKAKKIEGDFGKLPNANYNSQHWQVPGMVLVKVETQRRTDTMNPTIFLNLFHPDTDPVTGHIDVVVTLLLDEIMFMQYNHSGICLADGDEALSDVWPTGVWDLMMTVATIEECLAELLEQELIDKEFEPLLRFKNFVISRLKN